MEKGETIFTNIPQLDERTRREVYEDFRQKLIVSFIKYPQIQEMFGLFNPYNKFKVDKEKINSKNSEYNISINSQIDRFEITIDKLGQIDNPNIILESIRFKAPRTGINDFCSNFGISQDT